MFGRHRPAVDDDPSAGEGLEVLQRHRGILATDPAGDQHQVCGLGEHFRDRRPIASPIEDREALSGGFSALEGRIELVRVATVEVVIRAALMALRLARVGVDHQRREALESRAIGQQVRERAFAGAALGAEEGDDLHLDPARLVDQLADETRDIMPFAAGQRSPCGFLQQPSPLCAV